MYDLNDSKAQEDFIKKSEKQIAKEKLLIALHIKKDPKIELEEKAKKLQELIRKAEFLINKDKVLTEQEVAIITLYLQEGSPSSENRKKASKKITNFFDNNILPKIPKSDSRKNSLLEATLAPLKK
jgi:thiamine monophosphate synthase